MVNMQNLTKYLTKNWPMFLVVTPDKIGVYDDMCLALQDTAGVNVHMCKKYKLSECESSIEGYHNYFYPENKVKRTYIPKKNRLYPIVEG